MTGPTEQVSRRLAALFLALGLSSGVAAFAQERSGESAVPQEERHEASEEGGEEQEYRNLAAFILANTYEAEGKLNIFTVGAEYARELNERFGVAGEFEYGPDPNAWVFVAPVVLKVTRELEVFFGPGVEHLSRRSSRDEDGDAGVAEDVGEGGRGDESPGDGSADNFFLFRLGAGYHIPIGNRFFLTPHVVLDLVDEEEGVAKAVVYGVNVGVVF